MNENDDIVNKIKSLRKEQRQTLKCFSDVQENNKEVEKGLIELSIKVEQLATAKKAMLQSNLKHSYTRLQK